MSKNLPEKDPASVEPYYVVWCDKDGTNDGSEDDTGELQGATISSSSWAVTPSGITTASGTTAAVTIRSVVYAINTVATIWLSSGTDGSQYEVANTIVTSDSRTLKKTLRVRVGTQY